MTPSYRLKAAPDPAEFMPVKAVQAMMADSVLERATASESRAQEKVNLAFEKGYFHGGMKDWALALCRSDEQAFDDFIAKSGPVFSNLLRPSHTTAFPPRLPSAQNANSPEALAICAQLGLKPDALQS